MLLVILNLLMIGMIMVGNMKYMIVLLGIILLVGCGDYCKRDNAIMQKVFLECMDKLKNTDQSSIQQCRWSAEEIARVCG